MKAIIAITMLFALTSAIYIPKFHSYEVDEFKKSDIGKKILAHLTENKLVGESEPIYVQRLTFAGDVYKLTLIDSERKLHLVRVFVAYEDNSINVTKLATVTKGTQVLIGAESIKEEAKVMLEKLFTNNNFDGITFSINGFDKFEHAMSDQGDDFVILAKYRLEGTNNKVVEMESLLMKESKTNMEDYFHTEDSMKLDNTDAACGEYITAVNCMLDKKCVVDKLQSFSKCSKMGNLRYIA